MSQSLEQIKKPSICFIHDWLIDMRGGEKVLEAMVKLFPEAPIYTLFFKKENLSPTLQNHTIHATFLQYIPWISQFYRWLLPLFPIAIRSLDVRRFDVVISSSHCVAKAVRIRKDALHLCYCNTPMRYLWEFSDEYLGSFPKFVRRLAGLYFNWLRQWDRKTSRCVTAFIANSNNIARKIERYYGRQASVIYPPVSIPKNPKSKGENFFLIVSALVPYKRVDLAIEAFNLLKKPLRIVGDGPLKTRLEKMVSDNHIVLEGWLTQEELLERYANARALIFPGEEDFGIVPLEAQTFGKPVIAFGKGGATETVLAYNETNQTRSVSQSTGLFFYEQTPNALIQQVEAFEQLQFDPAFIQTHAQSFSLERFQEQLADFLETFQIDAQLFSRI